MRTPPAALGYYALVAVGYADLVSYPKGMRYVMRDGFVCVGVFPFGPAAGTSFPWPATGER